MRWIHENNFLKHINPQMLKMSHAVKCFFGARADNQGMRIQSQNKRYLFGHYFYIHLLKSNVQKGSLIQSTFGPDIFFIAFASLDCLPMVTYTS